jgi:hypothetical protein
MKGLDSHTLLIPKGKPPLSFAILDALPCCTYFSKTTTLSQCKFLPNFHVFLFHIDVFFFFNILVWLWLKLQAWIFILPFSLKFTYNFLFCSGKYLFNVCLFYWKDYRLCSFGYPIQVGQTQNFNFLCGC